MFISIGFIVVVLIGLYFIAAGIGGTVVSKGFSDEYGYMWLFIPLGMVILYSAFADGPLSIVVNNP